MEFPLNVAIAGVITMIFFTRELRFTLPDIEVVNEISNLKNSPYRVREICLLAEAIVLVLRMLALFCQMKKMLRTRQKRVRKKIS